ncbi:Thiol-disulfide oxidoreductase ResA [Anatilimnocola aggregata]|uniref:Thiol-disulfide oxidoreductase ResA n=1 Tax=Anatilimnocola aggregata TaxID=2528021 RepID=A0A517YK24_9BACT|nr:TlpA disulfide reductase family protein [Anatilimnocola aggregata]QDU30575.1 Thiol-disulfide oxidoreductase ResA [Anatilimnocola aggregata]
MLRTLAITLLSLPLLSLVAAAADAPKKELLVGDPAPPLALKEFVKGEPVKEFAKGKVYVLEFWATWCGPCIKSIPHVTELQARHKEAVIIGVDVMEDADDDVKEFVKQMGKKMEYRVAIDAKDPKSEEAGIMARTWLEASYQEGIPASFIVNGDGKVAWIGHPMELDEPLAKIIAGKWDLAAATKTFKDEVESTKASKALDEALEKAMESGKPQQIVAVLDTAFAKTPALEKEHGALKFNALLAQDDQKEKALAYGKKLIDEVAKDDPNALYSIANALLTDDEDQPIDKVDAASGKLALQATSQLVKLLDGIEGMPAANKSVALESVALAHFASGNFKEAVAAQEQAIKMAKGSEREKDASLAATLKKYQAASQPGATKK